MTRFPTRAEREAMAKEATARYAAQESIRTIAEALGRSFGFTRGLLLEAGVQLRDKNWRNRKAGAR